MSDEAGETVIENPQLAWIRQHIEEGLVRVSQMFPRQPETFITHKAQKLQVTATINPESNLF